MENCAYLRKNPGYAPVSPPQLSLFLCKTIAVYFALKSMLADAILLSKYKSVLSKPSDILGLKIEDLRLRTYRPSQPFLTMSF